MAISSKPTPSEIVGAVKTLETSVNGLATVARTGSYTDLNNTPEFILNGTVLTIKLPSAQS